MRGMGIELSRWTTVEAHEKLKDIEVALIPVGSTEQHSVNMTLDTDTRLAFAVANEIAERMNPRLVVLPPIPVGVSYHHMDFAGSMTLSPNTLQAIVFDYIKSMQKHGINKFIFMNGHGGNQQTLSVAATTARYELGVHVANLFYWNLAKDETAKMVDSERFGHACEVEASFGLYLDPQIVRVGELQPAQHLDYSMRFSELEKPSKVDYPFSWTELTKDGSFGDATRASYEMGQELMEIIFERMQQFIEDFIKHGNQILK